MNKKFKVMKTSGGYTVYMRNNKDQTFQLSHIVRDVKEDTFKTEEAAESLVNLLKTLPLSVFHSENAITEWYYIDANNMPVAV